MSEPTKKDSTNELPMYDLGEAIKIVIAIHEKALETAAMPEVAKGCGYANPTSTPFYRRIVAARLFKLLNSPKAELTKIAWDYLKPDTTDAKQNALIQAIMGIKLYADIVNQHVGKKINLDLITNRLEKDAALSITRACAKICAYTFDSSLKFAGFIAPDGTVSIPAGGAISSKTVTLGDLEKQRKETQDEFEDNGESQTQTLYLDKSRKRKITINAPFTVSKDELERTRSWLGFVLIVEETKLNPETQ
jgi:hypothetical protein